MLSSAYQQEFTFVAFESLINSTPRTRATFSRRCSTPLKSLSPSRMSSFFISRTFAEILAAMELYKLCRPCNAKSSSVIVRVSFGASMTIWLFSV